MFRPRSRCRLRELLPLAGYGEEIDPMVEAWEMRSYRQKRPRKAPWDLIEEMFTSAS